MKSTFGRAALAICVGASGAAFAQGQDDAGIIQGKIRHRINQGEPLPAAAPTGGTGTVSPLITSHGGPVIGGAPNIHLIWYGSWAQTNGSDNAAGQQVVRDFLYGANGSNYLAINKGYTGSGSTRVTGTLGTVQEANFGYISGTRAKKLRDSDVASIVSSYISTHGGVQSNAVYFVLTSSDVNETSGFCTKYCGWHTHGTIAGADVKYSFVGNANRCLSSCAIQSNSPNGNAGVDGMLSVVAHELEEAMSDPDLNAWYDSKGAENGDKCAWTFGHAQFTAPNGSSANMTLPTASGGSRNYLIQRNLSASSVCYIDGVNLVQ
jgi:hypothetical protein